MPAKDKLLKRFIQIGKRYQGLRYLMLVVIACMLVVYYGSRELKRIIGDKKMRRRFAAAMLCVMLVFAECAPAVYAATGEEAGIVAVPTEDAEPDSGVEPEGDAEPGSGTEPEEDADLGSGTVPEGDVDPGSGAESEGNKASDETANEGDEPEDDENLEENPEEIPQETPEEISENLRALQEQINALPTGEEYRTMSADEQDAVYEMAASVSDAYFELSEEDQAKIDITRLVELFAVMNEGIETYGATGTVTFLNSGYPYGKDMGRSNITLIIETEGSVSSYQWQVSDSKDGSYTDISGATARTYTFTPVSGKWYRCVVDGTDSQAVMAVKPGEDGRTWTAPNGSWYIGNGSMAYMANGSMFDVTGLYTKNGTNYMLQTSFDKAWNLYSSTSAMPDAVGFRSASNADMDALRVAFDASDDFNMIFEADLADGHQAFSFGCDTQLGNGNTSGSYYDSAALNAMVKNGVLQQIAMIGAGTVEGAADDDPAFVIAPIDPASRFWIGDFSSRQTYAYNTSGGSATETINGANVVTLLEGVDSGMTMSWMNIPSGGTVKFRFSVGSVANTGAVNGKVNYEKETLTGLDPYTDYIITDDDQTTYTITSDANGEIPLSGTDKDGKPYDFAGKKITIAKTGSDDTPAEIEVVGRPDTPSKPSDLVDDEGETTTPIVDANIEIVELTTTSVIIAPKEGQQYAYSVDDITWNTITGTNENGKLVISGLSEGAMVFIQTRLAATSEAPASQWSESTQVKLKSTVKVTADGWNGTYNKAPHSISVNVTSPTEGATVTYSCLSDNNYSEENPTFIAAGEYTVYYRVTAPEYYPAYGSATVKIEPKEVELEWSNTELTYNGYVQTPVAEVKADSLYPGDACTVSVSGGQKDHSDSAYTATADRLSNPNYKLPVDATQSFTIAKKELEFRWGSKKLTYNGNEQAPKATLVEKVPGAALEVTGGRVDVGTGSAVVSLTSASSQNCDLKGTKIVEFQIFPKKITAAMVDAVISYTCTGSDITPTLSVKDGEKTLSKPNDYTLSGDTSGKEEGNYKVTVSGTGNYTGTVDIAYKITDSQPPTGTIKISDNQWHELLNLLSFGIFYKERQTVTITATDEGSGVETVSYLLTSNMKPMNTETLADLPEIRWNKISNGGSFTVNPDNQYVVYAKITDKSGNVTFISSDGIVLDQTAPVITGIENNKTYCADVAFSVSDAIELVSVKIDDDEKRIGGTYTIESSSEKADHRIVATDKAGNTTTCTITINAAGVHSFGEWKITKEETCGEKGMKSRTCTVADCGFTETQEIAMAGHEYNYAQDAARFVWAPEKGADGVVTGYTAKIYFVCKNDPSHTTTPDDCIVTSSCDENGGVVYTATKNEYSATKTTEPENRKKVDNNNPETSNIYIATAVADHAPATSFDLDKESAKNLMEQGEKTDYDSGEVAMDVTIYLEVQSISGVVEDDDKEKVNDLHDQLVSGSYGAESDVELGASFVDLSLYKTVTTMNDNIEISNTTTPITNTDEEITIKMNIPTDLPPLKSGYKRTYGIIRVHDDVAEVLDASVSGNQITFRTDKFSTYAITYVDTKDTSVTTPAESGSSDSSGGTVITPKPEKPEKEDPKKEEAEKDDPEKGNSESGKDTDINVDRTFHKLPLVEAKATKTAVKVSWKQVADADGYVLYGAPCNTKTKTYKFKKLAVIKNGTKISYADKNLKSGAYYKYYIKAYKLVNGKKVWLAKSKTIHVTTTGGKYGNAKAVKVNKTSVTLTKGKTFTIKATQVTGSKPIQNHVKIKYESTNKKIATVTSKGVIKTKGKGTCYIYVYVQNGVYKKIKVTVK